MRRYLFVCTRDEQLVRLERGNGSWSAAPVLEHESAQCVAADGTHVLVGTRGRGLLASADDGTTWRHIELAEPDVFSVAISASDGTFYAGTEPSHLYASGDGDTWHELEALQDIPSLPTWSFPPRPWTHHVRWIAPDPHRRERLLVGIELGGLMLSDDRGTSFSDHRTGAKRDTHSIVWHPHVEGRAYQAAGDGAAWSHDGGRTWTAADAGRDLPYSWAVAVDPNDPDRWYVSAATGPGSAHRAEQARGRLYRWEAGAWQVLALPTESMPYALAATADELLVGLADGHILSSRDRGETWNDTGVRVGSILSMAAV